MTAIQWGWSATSTDDAEDLFMCYWPCVYLHWRNVYSDPLSIFKLGYLSLNYRVVEVQCTFWTKKINRYFDVHTSGLFGLGCALHIVCGLFVIPSLESFFSSRSGPL